VTPGRAAGSVAARRRARSTPASREPVSGRVRLLLRAAIAALAAAFGLARATPLRAQTSAADPSDLQAWYSASLVMDLPNGWETSFQYRLRMVDDASSYRGSYLTFEGQKEVVSWMSMLGGYRLARVEGGTYHRFALGAEARYDATDRFRLSLRPQVQHQVQTFADDDEQSGDQKTLLRTRLRGRYELTDALDFYASTEPYFAFGEDYPIDNWRNTVGLKYTLPGDVAVDLFYIYRPDYARSYNRTFHVIGIELEIARSFP
jgi:hypothetical protein